MWITKKFARHQTRVRKKVLHDEKKKKERNACFLVTKKKVKTKNIALITLLVKQYY